MTMLDSKCDVCSINPAIGVASTSMPMSVAFCRECAQRGADPEIVFVCWYDDFGPNCEGMADGYADNCVTFKDGKYVSFREWAKTYTPPDSTKSNTGENDDRQ